MNRKSQLAGCLFALCLGALVALPAEAQNRPPKNHPQQEQKQQRQEQHKTQGQGRDQERASARGEVHPNRPPTHESMVPNTNRPPERARNQQNPNRPPVNTQPRKFNELNQEEKQRALNNNRDFQKRTPAERQQIQRGLENWNKLTPGQQSHVKNDVLPKWKQLPADRQRAIRSRLNVLQNMPESARNQHLADPNFTRGMNEEDKAMLQDLSHMHVGGAPDEPHE